MKSIFISFLAAALVSRASAATYTLGASQTGMGYSFLSGMAVGPMFPTMIAPANTGTSNHHMTAFLQYDLSGLAGVSSSDITTATARLYLMNNVDAGFGANPTPEHSVSVDFRLVDSAWTGSTLTWGNQPGGAYDPTTTVPVGAIVGTISGIDASGVWVELDITQVVKNWLDDPSSNFGLRLNQTSEVRDGTSTAVFPAIAAQSNPDSSLRPQLVVTTVPEPTVPAFSLLAGAAFLGFRRRAAA